MEGEGRIVVCDLEAGVGTAVRLQPGDADVVLVVANPTAKALDVARRVVDVAASRARLIVVANRVRDEADVDAIARALGDHELVAVPEEPVIAWAEREGLAPIDVDEDAPGVRALVALAERVAGATGSESG